MNRQLRPAYRNATALVLALLLAFSVMVGAPTASAQDQGAENGDRTLENAEFRWGLNPESAGLKTFLGHNFLAAGDASAVLTGAGQSIEEAQWKRSAGDVRIEKSPGTLATWKDATPTGSQSSGLEMVFTKGVGEVDPVAGTASVKWTGTASVIYYSGQSLFTISDPALIISDSGARVTATMNGIESAQGKDTWEKLPPESDVVIAEIPVGEISLTTSGFSVRPLYDGVRYPGGDQLTDGKFGAFPRGFVDYVSRAGIGPYWYSTGGVADPRKSPLPVTVSWDAADRAQPDNDRSPGVFGQVIDDTVEDILRAAGTDVSDTAAAWMDEAWKPLQPDAVNAARAGAQTAASGAGVPTDTVSQVDEAFEEHYAETYTATSPMTAGTVGGALAAVPASTSGGIASGRAGTAAGAPAPVSDQATVPAAANTPLGADVVYAQTSASGEAGTPTHEWQWWMGAALLALAAALFYLTVRRKD